jgi:two-component system phosphate regulon sensor histidine kinase PhoR
MSGFEKVETGCDISMIKNSDVLKIIDSTMESASSQENEISRLGRSIRCSSSYFELHSGPCVVVTMQDISDIKKLENMRYDFVSNVTHELNTPLTSIQGFIETLKSGAIKDPETAEKFLNIIEIESERLSNLIGDILTLSSIENEYPDRENEFVDIHDAASEALLLLKSKIDAKGITVINDIDSLAGIEANYDRIKQLFINLLDNAVKYNRDFGEIRLYTVKKDGIVEIHVRDTGIGIDKKHRARLFERFYRVDKGRSSELGGTGLGLSIVKHIAMLYGGRVSVKSEPGKGSDFCVTFPKAD